MKDALPGKVMVAESTAQLCFRLKFEVDQMKSTDWMGIDQQDEWGREASEASVTVCSVAVCSMDQRGFQQ